MIVQDTVWRFSKPSYVTTVVEGFRLLTEEQLHAEQQRAEPELHLVGLAPDIGCRIPGRNMRFGVYVRATEEPLLINHRPTYVNRHQSDVMMWWKDGKWHVGSRDKAGTTSCFMHSAVSAAILPR